MKGTIAAQVPLSKTQLAAIAGANKTSGLLFCREATGWALVRKGYATVKHSKTDGVPPMFYLTDEHR